MSRFSWICKLVIVLTLGLVAETHAQRLTWLGTLGGNFSEGADVSADGRVVVGTSRDADGRIVAFRWVRGQGMQSLGALPGYDFSDEFVSAAYAVSADGEIVVGTAYNSEGYPRVFLWESGTVSELNPLGGVADCFGWNISGDGTTIVGGGHNQRNRYRAFRLTRGQPTGQDLGTLYNLGFSEAYGVSADGSVVVGTSTGPRNSNSSRRPFVWRNGQMRDLGVLPQHTDYYQNLAEAWGVSPNGRFVVGLSVGIDESDNLVAEGFIWTEESGISGIGTLGGTQSALYGVSDKGEAVGFSWISDWNARAILWTPESGLVNLNERFANLLTDGSILVIAINISPDGRYIVGTGFNATTGRSEAFLLETRTRVEGDINGDGCVDDTDLLILLFNFGSEGGQGDLNNDNLVNDQDLIILLNNFGRNC